MSEEKIGEYGEPWRVDEFEFGLVDAREFEVEIGLPEYDRRIVECVNACAGLEDPRAEVEALVREANALVTWADLYQGNEARAIVKTKYIKRLEAALAPFLESREAGTPGREATEGREG